MSSPAHVILYGRPACHLCDDARAVILAVRADVPFDFDEVDIDDDDALVREYGLRIPVITIDGQEAFEIRVEAAGLRDALGLSA